MYGYLFVHALQKGFTANGSVPRKNLYQSCGEKKNILTKSNRLFHPTFLSKKFSCQQDTKLLFLASKGMEVDCGTDSSFGAKWYDFQICIRV